MSTISKVLGTPPSNFSTTLNGGINDSALTITLDDTTGLASEGVGVIYALDADSNPDIETIEFIHWTGVSGSDITLTDTGDRGITGSYNGATSHTSGDKFEVWVHPAYYMGAWATVEHNTDGTHSDVTADTLSMAGNIDMNTNKITDVGTPTANTDVATKGYVDGSIKAPKFMHSHASSVTIVMSPSTWTDLGNGFSTTVYANSSFLDIKGALGVNPYTGTYPQVASVRAVIGSDNYHLGSRTLDSNSWENISFSRLCSVASGTSVAVKLQVRNTVTNMYLGGSGHSIPTASFLEVY